MRIVVIAGSMAKTNQTTDSKWWRGSGGKDSGKSENLEICVKAPWIAKNKSTIQKDSTTFDCGVRYKIQILFDSACRYPNRHYRGHCSFHIAILGHLYERSVVGPCVYSWVHTLCSVCLLFKHCLNALISSVLYFGKSRNVVLPAFLAHSFFANQEFFSFIRIFRIFLVILTCFLIFQFCIDILTITLSVYREKTSLIYLCMCIFFHLL